MRLLFELDAKDYDPNGVGFVRHSARSIIIHDGKIMMVHVRKYNYYKFPGGGIEQGESPESAMIRETREEAGMSVTRYVEYGCVHRVQASTHGDADYFLQDNFYYLCDAEQSADKRELDDYEREEGFTPVGVEPQVAIDANRHADHGEKKEVLEFEREAKVLELLIKEGYFDR